MNAVLVFVGGNALSVALLFAAALAVERFVPRPSVRHAAWLAVLLRLLIPPILAVPVGGATPPAPEGAPALAAVAVDAAPEPPGPLGIAAASALPGPTRSPMSTRNLLAALTFLELAGAAFLLGLATVRWNRFRRRLRGAVPAPPELRAQVAALAARLGVKRVPRLVLTEECVSPLLVALPRLTLVLPQRLLRQLDPDEISALVAHELAHVRRHDAWVRPLETLATAFYWWFPALHAARRRLRAAEEAACDALVLRAHPHLRRAYADGLLKTVEFVSLSPAPPVLATGAADSRDLKERLVNILQFNAAPPLPRRLRRLVAVVALLAVSLTPGWTRVTAAVDETAPPDAPPPMAPADFDNARAELAFRKAELELQKQLVALHQRQQEMDQSMEALQQQQQLKGMQAHLEAMLRAGHAKEAEVARGEYDEALRHLEVDRAIRAREVENEAKSVALEMRLAEIELAQAERLGEGDEKGMRELGKEAQRLHAELRAMDLDRLKLEMERAEAELQIRREQYERAAQQLEDADAE